MSIFKPEQFPLALKNLLQIDLLLFYGQNVSIDCTRIEALGVSLVKRFEFRDATLCDNPEMNRTSLENLALAYL